MIVVARCGRQRSRVRIFQVYKVANPAHVGAGPDSVRTIRFTGRADRPDAQVAWATWAPLAGCAASHLSQRASRLPCASIERSCQSAQVLSRSA
ncbi:hypothetical protein Msi02_79520 [Microbispora siamensis]|uniref:Uncharacterized protein n=1 Tax=Microbispora siamensis TaxID=564413 RepID=A0ABQ4H0I5_9ACTN|nr:hypothetical protein Msi02_79520 [Microbispora siamensis]